MKYLYVLLCVIIFTSPLKSQDEEGKPLSKAETFSSKSGTLIEKQFSTVGSFGGILVKVLKLKDLNDNLSISALRFEYDYSSKYSTDTKIATLDNDEVEGLIKSIKNLQSNVFTSTRETYTEVTFTSRNDFQAGAYFSTDKQNWVSYIKLSKYDSNSIVFIQQKDLETLLGIIEIAQLKMK